MRDDLHKSCPSRRPWKRALRCCVRDSEHGEKAEAAFRRAIADDWNAEVSPQTFQKLHAAARTPQAELFGGKLTSVCSSLQLGGTGAVMDEQLVGQARVRDGAHGAFNEAAFEGAIANVLAMRLNAETRGLHGYVSREGATAPCLNEVKRASGATAAVLKQLAREAIENGGRISVARRVHKEISTEENLLKR